MENRHQPNDLYQMRILPLSVKIRMTQSRIRAWYDYWDGNVYVSISGGKDSQVLAHIVKEMYPDIPLVFVNTGLEYDSVRLKGEELADKILRPGMNFVEVIKRYGYPIISKEVSLYIHQVRVCEPSEKNAAVRRLRTEGIRSDGVKVKTGKIPDKWLFLLDAPFKISNYCCDVMKKKPAHSYEKTSHQKPFIGTMASESEARKKSWFKYGCNAFEKKNPSSQPLSFWRERDILQYIKENNLKIADIYGDVIYEEDDYYTTGADRTGCTFCLFGIAKDPERFLRLKEVEPKKYDYVMRGGCFNEQRLWEPGYDENGVFGLGYKFIINWLNEHGSLNIKY